MEEKIDCIIGCATNYNWDTLKYWINSINKSGFTGDKVLVLGNCDKESVQKILAAGFLVVPMGKEDENGNLKYESKLVVHVERFAFICEFLYQHKYRYVITTDVKDVIFQHNPIPKLEKYLQNDKKYVFSSESMLYKDEPWGDRNLFETFDVGIHQLFRTNEIYNVGVLAGTADAIRDLALIIYLFAIRMPISICDQSTFNVLISNEPYKSISEYTKSESGWACQLGTTVDPSKINDFRPHLLEPSPIMPKDKVLTSTGEEFTIVHQYDRIPHWKNIIMEQYA